MEEKFEDFEGIFFETNYKCEILNDEQIIKIKDEIENNNSEYVMNESRLEELRVKSRDSNHLEKEDNDNIKSAIKSYEIDVKESEIIPICTKIIYSLPSFGKMSCLVLLNIQALMYYESIGAGLLYISFFVSLARAIEIILKPAIAHWSDEIKSSLGRRKPFMLFGCIFYSTFLILLFSPPGMSTGTFYISMWFGCFYVLFFIADTFTNVPYLALGPELSRDTNEREKLYIYFYSFQYIGVLFAASAPVILNRLYRACDCQICYDNPLVSNLQECIRQCEIICDLKKNKDSLFFMSLFIGVFYVVTIFLLCYSIRENKKSFNSEKVHLLPSLYRLSSNRPFLKLIIPWIIDIMITTTFGTMLPFFLNFVINPQKYCINQGIDLNSDVCSVNLWLGYTISCFFVFCILSMFVWHYLVGIYGKKKCWEIYSLISIPGFSLFLMCNEGSMHMLIFASICVAIPAGGAYLNDVFISDVIEYDEFLTGKRNEGLFTVFAAFIPKVVSIFAQSIPLAIMSFLGFVSSYNGQSMHQPRAVIDFIRFFFIALPCILALLSFYFKTKYPIDSEKTLEEVRKAIIMQKDFANYLNNKCDYYKIFDPIYKNYHIQIFALNKNQRDTKIIVDHFNDLKYLKILYSMDLNGLKSQVKLNILGCAIVLLVFIITLFCTFTFLQTKSISLIPLFSLFIITFSIIALVFNIIRYNVVKRIIRGQLELDLKFLKLLILKALNDDQNNIINNAIADSGRPFSNINEKLLSNTKGNENLIENANEYQSEIKYNLNNNLLKENRSIYLINENDSTKNE